MDWGKQIFTPEPSVKIIDWPQQSGFDISVGAARTCYNKKLVPPEKVRKTPKTEKKSDEIFKGILEGGHHTTIQHPQYSFIITGMSRQAVWSFMHSHPFYNSEQVSQRYVDVLPKNFIVPPLEDKARELYEKVCNAQMQAYEELQKVLEPVVTEEYFKIFPGRKKDADKWKGAVHKKIIEQARYVINIATLANMYHTVSGLTLLRYQRMSNMFDVPLEARLVVDKMVEAARQKDPEFFGRAEKFFGKGLEAVPLEDTPELKYFSTFFSEKRGACSSKDFAIDFGVQLRGYQSKLVDWKVNAEETLANSFRQILGLTGDMCSDEEAIEYVLNPAKNTWLGSALNVTTLSKISRAMHHVHYTFTKKISHTADSQNQRHRMTPESAPILVAQLNPYEPDCIWPAVFDKCPQAREIAEKATKFAVESVLQMTDSGVPFEFAQYLLPNATALRFTESGDLLNLHHKYGMRLCYNAQEEIWRTGVEEVRQIGEKHPVIARHIAAPCKKRLESCFKPYCPEGDRFCGVKVWNKDITDYERVI